MGELLGSIAFSLIVIAVIAGAWAWISTLFRKGIMALLGFDRVCVQQFETVLLYRNGRFEKALPPGRHRIRAGSRQLARIDRRPEVFRFAQGAVSADRIAVNPPLAVRSLKEMAYRSREMSLADGMRMSALMGYIGRNTEDAVYASPRIDVTERVIKALADK